MHSYVSPHVCIRHNAFVEVREQPLGINSLSTMRLLRIKLLSSDLMAEIPLPFGSPHQPPLFIMIIIGIGIK